jgi:DUF1365 family protein
VHAFGYPAFMLRLPLSGLHALPGAGLPLGRRGAVSFDPADHGDGTGALREWLAALLHAHGVVADGEAVLYAFPRMLGHAFKPVSFYACHDPGGGLRAVVAEVNNTFGERHHYVLHDAAGAALRDGATLVARFGGRAPIRLADPVAVSVDVAAAHVFDPVSGRALHHPE